MTVSNFKGLINCFSYLVLWQI